VGKLTEFLDGHSRLLLFFGKVSTDFTEAEDASIGWRFLDDRTSRHDDSAICPERYTVQMKPDLQVGDFVLQLQHGAVVAVSDASMFIYLVQPLGVFLKPEPSGHILGFI